jgi:hypothetical protein
MKRNEREAVVLRGGEETGLLKELFHRPDRLRERLVLAIALSPPKARRIKSKRQRRLRSGG